MITKNTQSKSNSVPAVRSGSQEDEDELDYMSDAFVNNLNDIKPGISVSRSVKRQRLSETKSKHSGSSSNKQLKSITEGLQKQVGPENKGFNLLARMGYTPGKGLGKNADGRAEPIGIEFPKGREGLGFASARKEKSQVKEYVQLAIREEFRGIMAARFQYSKYQRQLKAGRRICQDLDLAEGIAEPCNVLFWPLVETSEADETSQTQESQDKMPLKRKFSVVEVNKNAGDGDDSESPDSELASLDTSQIDGSLEHLQKLLSQLVGYLRGQHYYCFWCSARYDSFGELLEQCPGETEDDHG